MWLGKIATITTDSLNAADVVMPYAKVAHTSNENVDECKLIPVNEPSVDVAIVPAVCHLLFHVDHDMTRDPHEIAGIDAVQMARMASSQSLAHAESTS